MPAVLGSSRKDPRARGRVLPAGARGLSFTPGGAGTQCRTRPSRERRTEGATARCMPKPRDDGEGAGSARPIEGWLPRRIRAMRACRGLRRSLGKSIPRTTLKTLWARRQDSREAERPGTDAKRPKTTRSRYLSSSLFFPRPARRTRISRVTGIGAEGAPARNRCI